MEINPRDVGRLEAQVASLTRVVEELHTTIKGLETRVDAMGLMLAEAKGGWKVLLAFGTITAAAGSALTWVLQHVRLQ